MTDWIHANLSDCLEALLDYRGKSPTKSAAGIPVLSAKVVKTSGILRPIEQKVAEDYYDQWMVRGLPQSGDVVMTTEAPMGEVIQLDKETATYALGQRIVCLRGKHGVLDNSFLRYLLTSPRQREILFSYATGTTVLGISQKSLRAMPICYPPWEEQRLIGEFFSALDDKIELNRQMNGTLEAMARALFKDWFVDFGPTRAKMAAQKPYLAQDIWDLFPDRLDDEAKPEGWQLTPLGACISILTGGTPKTSIAEYWNGDVPWFSVVDAPSSSDVFVSRTQKYISHPGLDNSAASLLPQYTIVISARGTVGKLAILGRAMAINQSCYGIEAKRDLGQYFIYQSLKRSVDSLKSHAHGSVFDTITRSTFNSIFIVIPNRNISFAYQKLVAPLYERILANNAENHTLAQMRDLLLPKLMSGEIRITDAEKMVEEVA